MNNLSAIVRQQNETIRLLQEKIESLRDELTITKNALANATAKLHGTRQHITEVTMK